MVTLQNSLYLSNDVSQYIYEAYFVVTWLLQGEVLTTTNELQGLLMSFRDFLTTLMIIIVVIAHKLWQSTFTIYDKYATKIC